MILPFLPLDLIKLGKVTEENVSQPASEETGPPRGNYTVEVYVGSGELKHFHALIKKKIPSELSCCEEYSWLWGFLPHTTIWASR